MAEFWVPSVKNEVLRWNLHLRPNGVQFVSDKNPLLVYSEDKTKDPVSDKT